MQIRRLITRSAPLALVLTLVCGVAAIAQTPLGRVAGTVLDESGAVLPGATVTLTNTGTAQAESTTANEVGAFVFPQVPVGTYKINVSLQGFQRRAVDHGPQGETLPDRGPAWRRQGRRRLGLPAPTALGQELP